MVEVEIQKIQEPRALALPMPNRATSGSSGFDLRAAIDNPIKLCQVGPCSGFHVVPCGIRIALPPGYEAQVRPRSGLAARSGLWTLLGTIDADYRGEIGAIMAYWGTEWATICPGDRIAQLVIQRMPEVCLIHGRVTGESTPRGEGGFGSTGLR